MRAAWADIDTTGWTFVVATAGSIVLTSGPATIAFVKIDEGRLAAGLMLPLMRALPSFSGNESPLLARFLGIGGDRFVTDEVEVAFDRKAEAAAKRRNLGEANVSQLRVTLTQIAEAE